MIAIVFTKAWFWHAEVDSMLSLFHNDRYLPSWQRRLYFGTIGLSSCLSVSRLTQKVMNGLQ